ncbi:glycosyl transferase family 1 [Aliihoeflea sp. PC F10.4]
MIHILYFVHDLADPAVSRRVTMLRAGEAEVTLAGFCRTEIVPHFGETRAINLGTTSDGRFAQRLAAVANAAAGLTRSLRTVARPDFIIARNLEMLALAARAKALFGDGQVPVIYESLDIHRLLLRDDAIGAAMRGAERRLGRDVKALVTSSPAFSANYFERFKQVSAPVKLVENKFFSPEPLDHRIGKVARPAGPPWRIGWFGALRCSRSLQLFADFTRRMDGAFKVVLRGKPALSEFKDFHGFVESEPHLSFEGPYRNPQDLESIYRDVHFSWVIDFFEDGLNSKWLLPNRLYEGCRFGAVPIAMADTEIANFLGRHQIGLTLQAPTIDELVAKFGTMDQAEFGMLEAAVEAVDTATWTCDADECVALVADLAALCGVPSTRSIARAAA